MAAIIEPRHLHLAPLAERRGPRPAPRHLRAVPTSTAFRSTSLAPPRRVVEETASWLSPATAAAMVATVVVAALLALGVAGGAFSALVPEVGAGSATVAAPAAALGGGSTVEVAPGDSYWSIARTLQPRGDVRPLVHRLQVLNGGVALRPGMEVVLPA